MYIIISTLLVPVQYNSAIFLHCNNSYPMYVFIMYTYTGFVTTARVTHATPGALYAHINSRDWECDTKIPESQKDCTKDIARQLIEDAPGNNFKVCRYLHASNSIFKNVYYHVSRTGQSCHFLSA